MQFEHEKLDVLLNTAEGNGTRQRPSRAKSFDDARGSATECAAWLLKPMTDSRFKKVRDVSARFFKEESRTRASV